MCAGNEFALKWVELDNILMQSRVIRDANLHTNEPALWANLISERVLCCLTASDAQTALQDETFASSTWGTTACALIPAGPCSRSPIMHLAGRCTRGPQRSSRFYLRPLSLWPCATWLVAARSSKDRKRAEKGFGRRVGRLLIPAAAAAVGRTGAFFISSSLGKRHFWCLHWRLA